MSSESYFERVKARVMKKAQEEYEAEKMEERVKAQLGLTRKMVLGLCPGCRKKLKEWLKTVETEE